MPKRKRDTESSVEELLKKSRTELFHALKAAKGFERQRLSKRIRDEKSSPEKVQRLEREVLVLKSLDLHNTANAHLCSLLLRLKPVAESPGLPAAVRESIPKPNLPEAERAALHNVTSSLCNRREVREVVDRTVAAVCAALGVPVPQKRRQRASMRGPAEENQEPPRLGNGIGPIYGATPSNGGPRGTDEALGSRAERDQEHYDRQDSRDQVSDEDQEDEEERAVSRLDAMLGESSEDEGEDDGAEIRGAEHPMDISSAEEDDDDEESEEEPTETGEDSEGDSSTSELRGRSRTTKIPTGQRLAKQGRASGSTFLPTLIGGYISGSEESASDADVAPPPARKNRRGQKARQAIWEKKYGASANHVKTDGGASQGSRDAGWDPKRGAVDQGKSSMPWERSVRNRTERTGDGVRSGWKEGHSEKKRSTKDNEGPLHASWEARKRAKEKEATAVFQGKKTVF